MSTAAQETTALAVMPPLERTLTAAELVARVERVREVMHHLMQDGVHYGKVPNTPKPSLWKPGAELLLMTFRVGVRLETEDLSNHDDVRYRVKVIGFYQPTGETLGEGIGEASTNEDKWHWRAMVHAKEWDATPEDRRRIKFKADGTEIKQVRTNPADLANTILLMAVKRGTVNLTRVITACSDIFDQDLEDLPEELRQAGSGATTAASEKREVKRASETTGPKPAAPVDNGTGTFITAPCKVKDLQQKTDKKDKPFYVLTLVGDSAEYTTRNEKQATELGQFKGTDHLVRIAFKKNEWNGKTYLNVENFTIAEAEAPAAPSAPPADSASNGTLNFRR